MTPNQGDSGLLEALKRLYLKIVSRYVDQRQTAYHSTADGDLHQAITTALERRIESLSADGKAAVAAPAGDAGASAKHANHSPGGDWVPVEHGVANDLSRHFEQTHTGSTFLPEVGEKLKKSTWEHIHAALRSARQGDAKTAKLHADIANNALREAAHYLPPQDYTSFAAAVGDMLAGNERRQG